MGVRNYLSPHQGIGATIATLRNGRYGNILDALRTGTDSVAAARALAASPWGTGALVLKVLGAGGGLSAPPNVNVLSPAVAPQAPVSPLANPVVQQVLAANDRLLGVAPPNFAAIAQNAVPPSANTTRAPVSAVPAVRPYRGPVQIAGNTQGVQPVFLAALERAVQAAGGDEIRVTSGFRTPAHNAAVNGVPHSLHTRGLALDGYARIQGRWIPLGAALKTIAPRYGLRSGDTPGFFRGSLDPVHVDFGYGH